MKPSKQIMPEFCVSKILCVSPATFKGCNLFEYRRLFLSVCLFFMVLISGAQNTMYFMEHMPQKQFFNPAFIPDVDFYLYLPGVNGLSFNAFNSGFNYSELDHYLENLDKPGYNPDKFVNSIGETNRFLAEARANLFGFGFWVSEKDFFSFNVSMNQSLVLDAESDIAYLMADFDEINESKFPIMVDGIDLRMNAYMNMGVIYSRKITESLTIGINPGINYYMGGIRTKELSYLVELESFGEYDKDFNQTFSGEVLLGLPVPINPDAVTNGELDMDEPLLPEDWAEEIKPSELMMNKNFSINLGAVYQLDNMNFSLSLLNLGTSNWKHNAYRIEGDEDVIRISEEKIKIGIPLKLYLGANRQFAPRWNYGVMMENTFHPDGMKSKGTISLNGDVGRMLSTSVSYTAGYRYDNFGLGCRVRFFPGLDLYFVTDNLIQVINYKKSYQMSGAVGVNFSLGIKNYIAPRPDDPEVSVGQ